MFSNRAAAASKLGRHAEARTDATTAVEYDPDFTKAYLRRATAHSAMKDFEAALRDFEKASFWSYGSGFHKLFRVLSFTGNLHHMTIL